MRPNGEPDTGHACVSCKVGTASRKAALADPGLLQARVDYFNTLPVLGFQSHATDIVDTASKLILIL
jgi:hypothetical protein